MVKRARQGDLQVVAKYKKHQLDYAKHGALLVNRSGYQIEELCARAATDRFQFAKAILREANQLIQSQSRNRLVINRLYYAMYHAARAMVYLDTGGDDHEDHSKLPGNIPQSFPNALQWETNLKDARLLRNEADYDPYPRNDNAFAGKATTLMGLANQFVNLVAIVLRSRGCRI